MKATVWKNPTKNGYMHSVVFLRIYKDADQWKSSQSFSRSEMFDLGRCLLDAHAWVVFGSRETQDERHAAEESPGEASENLA